MNRLFLNSFPLSEWTTMTLAPFAITWSINAVATAGAVLPTMGTAVRNLLNKSIEVKQYVSLLVPAGKGPIRSTQLISPT